MTLRCLFVDFNSSFAAVQPFDDPALRVLVAVVPVANEGTCCIAASSQARAFGGEDRLRRP